MWEIREGDVMDRLREMPSESVQCVVTSPPYWGLRDYGTAKWEGGEAVCDHLGPPRMSDKTGLSHPELKPREQILAEPSRLVPTPYRQTCGKCGARRIDAQIGLEPTPGEYVAKMVEVFREVRRVLRKDGTLWLNLGDSYASSATGSTSDKSTLAGSLCTQEEASKRPSKLCDGLKSKDLVGIPWRVAFALQADGWWLRSDIIWAKPNPMPESVTDRPTKSHEYIFLLTKSASYYFDAEAVREKSLWVDDEGYPLDSWGRRVQPPTHHLEGRPYSRVGLDPIKGGRGVPQSLGAAVRDGKRNIRSVWNIATQPFPEAHFATFPEKLVEPCIKAGTSEKGCCAECGAPWERLVDTERTFESGSGRAGNLPSGKNGPNLQGGGETLDIRRGPTLHTKTTGWKPSCPHLATINPCTVLDPFAGSGTVGVVALRLDRSFLGIELKPAYAQMARTRIYNDAPLLNGTLP